LLQTWCAMLLTRKGIRHPVRFVYRSALGYELGGSTSAATLRTLGILISLVIALGAASCSRSEGREVQRNPKIKVEAANVVQTIRAPVRDYSDPVAVPGLDRLVAVHDPPDDYRVPFQSSLVSISLDGHAESLRLPRERACKATSFGAPTALTRSVIGYSSTCLGNRSRVPDHAVRLWTYDLRTGRVSPLRPYSIALGARRFSFSRATHQLVINDGAGLYEHLLLLTRSRARRLQIPVTRPGSPAFRPSGTGVLALDAVPQELQAKGIARAGLPRRIYLYNLRTRSLRALTGHLDDVGPVAWSPNGNSLAFAAAESGRAGLWVLDVRSGALRLVFADRNVQSATWLDSRRLAVAVSRQAQKAAHSAGIYILRLALRG